MTKWPYWPNYQMSILTRWPYWLDDHIGQMIRWQNDKMTILTRWPDDQIIRWSYDQMTTWLDDHSLIISKTNRKSPSLLRSLWGLINGYGLPIPDRMMIYDDLTILMYRNIIKNNSLTGNTHCIKKCHQSPQNWDVISHTRSIDDVWSQ